MSSGLNSIKIAVIGLGKIGLPLAVQYAKKGNTVVGVDTNEDTICKVNLGIEPFPGEENLSVFLQEVVERNLFTATSNYEKALESAEVIVIATPLLINDLNHPDFTILDSVSQSIGLHIRPGTLVILETTVPVGTTRNRLSINIEKFSILKAGIDFLVAFSPERVFTGRIFNDLKRYPKLVGGINEESSLRAMEFYESVLDFDERPDLSRKNGVWLMKSAEAAEFSKLAETTYRDVNIALANQFMLSSWQLGLDFYEIREACNSQTYSNIHHPGIAVGGHCIPVYPYLYLSSGISSSLTLESRRVNESMPEMYINRIKEKYGSLIGKRVLIYGISYRDGVRETAFSGAFALLQNLVREGCSVYGHDPLFSNEEIQGFGFKTDSGDLKFDLTIVHTLHPGCEIEIENRREKLGYLVMGRDFSDRGKFENDLHKI